ncbi:MAG: hypothetical protein WCY43_00105 [Patescibacteria group bacterium]|nr:hypothetical protein [Patescibacteria group bacterium]
MEDNNDINLGKYSNKNKSLSKANIGLWFLEHKRHMILLVIVILGGASLLLYSFFFYNLFDYLRYDRDQRAAINELTTVNVGVGAQRLAIPLETIKDDYFQHDNIYDFMAMVKNSNTNFFAKISYCFVDGQKDLACADNIVFPEEEKYLLIISKKIEDKPKNIEFKIKNVAWERVDIRKYPNWKEYYDLRANFKIDNIKFEKETSPSAGKNFNNLNFTIENQSPYNYWEVPLQIILMNRGSVVGVNTYNISEFRSSDLKDIKMTWPNSVSSVSDVKVLLNLNVLDESNYISYK